MRYQLFADSKMHALLHGAVSDAVTRAAVGDSGAEAPHALTLFQVTFSWIVGSTC